MPLLLLNVPANALIHPVKPDDVLGAPVVSVDKRTVRDPVGRLERFRSGEEEPATVERSGLKVNDELDLRRWPNAVARVSLPLRRETHHGKGTSGASARSGSSRDDAVEGDSLKVPPVRGVVA